MRGMRIVPKLSLAFVAATCGILVVNGWFRVRREVAFYESDRARDHETIARSLGVAVASIWKSDGRAKALETVDSFDRDVMRVRWHDEPVPIAADASAGQPITTLDAAPKRTWHTWVPVEIDGKRQGALEMIEPASSEERFARSTEIDTIASAAAIVALSALLSLALGQWLVGRPVSALASKARRVGAGDFGGPVVLPRQDELYDLAKEMNAMSENLSTTLAQLRHADRLTTVGKLASGVAHELGTPLNVVHARAAMIAHDATSSSETQESATVIVRAAERMTKIIRQLLQFARKKTVTKSRCDVLDICRDAIELVAPIASRRSARIALASESHATKLDADAGEIQQVVTNLVMNAIQAMPKGGRVDVVVRDERATPPIDLGTSALDCLSIEVADEGTGIAPENLARVFEPFFTTKDVGEGTGLGLAVSYGIVREHGGWIRVESEVDRGTRFRVYLPRPAGGPT